MSLFTFMIILFVLGYLLIALEHPIKISKTATALLLACVLWTLLAIGGSNLLAFPEGFNSFQINNPGSNFMDWLIHGQLVHALGETAEIIFFLLGAMTIVELIDTQGGFKIITDKIATTKKVKLLWVICILAFFMSAILDNMTTSIVMVALLRKLIGDKKDRWFFAGMVILAANSGGAWSPMGDVTTIMLWVSGKVSALNIIEMTFIASFVSLLVPLLIMSLILKGDVERPQDISSSEIQLHTTKIIPSWESTLFLLMGVGLLLCVPLFKTLTHLPPYLGMLGALGILWTTSEIIHRKSAPEIQHQYSINNILTRIDVPSVLFFLGILMAVSALATAGHLTLLSHTLDKIPLEEPSKYYVINILIGIFSSVIDNVPLVAGSMGMYNFPIDHYFWEMLAYCAGTGGSILIIGSAAGVAIMGIEKIDFIWYLKHISWIALVGYLAGCGAFVLEKNIRGTFKFEEKQATEAVEVQMNEISIRNYLTGNTFYIVEERPDKNIRDSSIVHFISYDTDKPIAYYGTKITTYTKKQQLLEILNDDINMTRGQILVGNTIGDTLAPVRFGNRQLAVTASGQVYFITDNGSFLLQRQK